MAIRFRQGRFRLICDCCDQEIVDPCKGGVAIRARPGAGPSRDGRDPDDLILAHVGFCRQHLLGRIPGARWSEFKLFQVLEALLAYRTHPTESEEAA